MLKELLKQELEGSRRFFHTSVSVFTEADSGYAPSPEVFTVANHVAHVAHTIDWFLEGTFGKGFDMDFGAIEKEVRGHTSLKKSLEWFDQATARAITKLESLTEAQLAEHYPEGSLVPGPKAYFVSCLVDHNAHHRGALTVYARQMGRVAPMPYA